MFWTSPRTWGWTQPQTDGGDPAVDVPTHVGVDRTGRGPHRGRRRRPHARGGGPLPKAQVDALGKTSPRTWGWTVAWRHVGLGDGDVPTHVGVDLQSRHGPIPGARRPHARGG